MAPWSYVVSAMTPIAETPSIKQVGEPSSSRKRKASTPLEGSSLVGILNRGHQSQDPETTDPTAKEGEEDEISVASANAALTGVYLDPLESRRISPRDRPPKEKRLRMFRKKAPQSFLERLDRVRSQRMFLVDRERIQCEDGTVTQEVFDIAGTTGNLYHVIINKSPQGTCPDGKTEAQCKHIVYILVNVLKAPEHLSYQLAFLSTELATIFATAPTTPQSRTDASSRKSSPGSRKPIEGDCPVCVMEFSPRTEEIVWCRAACGNNIHKQCFKQWAVSKPGLVKCVYCRSPWKADEKSVSVIEKMGQKNEEGYVNVAAQLGLSQVRDWSSYHQPWVRSRGSNSESWRWHRQRY